MTADVPPSSPSTPPTVGVPLPSGPSILQGPAPVYDNYDPPAKPDYFFQFQAWGAGIASVQMRADSRLAGGTTILNETGIKVVDDLADVMSRFQFLDKDGNEVQADGIYARTAGESDVLDDGSSHDIGDDPPRGPNSTSEHPKKSSPADRNTTVHVTTLDDQLRDLARQTILCEALTRFPRASLSELAEKTDLSPVEIILRLRELRAELFWRVEQFMREQGKSKR